VAVTVLTSFDQQDLADMGYDCASPIWFRCACAKPERRGWTGWSASPLDAATVRAQAGPRAILVTRGYVRVGGERRSETRGHARRAVRDGADYVVMGRQITRAADPSGEAARVADEMRQGCGSRHAGRHGWTSDGT